MCTITSRVIKGQKVLPCVAVISMNFLLAKQKEVGDRQEGSSKNAWKGKSGCKERKL